MELFSDYSNTSENLFISDLLRTFDIEDPMGSREWAEKKRFLSSAVTSRPGQMDCSRTPWMLHVLTCLDNPDIRVIVGRKPAQIAWTEIINCYIGRNIDNYPQNMIIAFPTLSLGRKFYKQKLKILIESTPSLSLKIGNLNKHSFSHIPFPGGFVSLVTIGSSEEGKSSSVPVMIIEEPDGVKANINNQGDGLSILSQRLKSFPESKLVYAGTPTELAFSNVEKAYRYSNKMIYMTPCHKCGDFHELSFKNFKYDTFSDRKIDEEYGIYNPETAYYQCPVCSEEWDFNQKNKNVAAAIDFFNEGWQITNPDIKHISGFSFSELQSSFQASSFVSLAKQKLKAQKAYEEGDDGLLRSWVNNSEGRGYEAKSVGIDIEDLIKKRQNYPENVVPFGGLVLTCGIDVQDNRFAIVVRAWGRNGNSWLVCWTEIFGYTLDWDDPIWENLTQFIQQVWEHSAGNGRFLKIAAGTIDTANGAVTELAYRWVLQMNSLGINMLAGKGYGIGKVTDKEIYTEPVALDSTTLQQQRKSLAEKMGVHLYSIGAHKAHGEVLRRFTVRGARDRHHHCKTSYGGYEEGLLSCVLLPDGRYIKKPSADKEVIDCEKMALHAAYAIGLRNYSSRHWEQIENAIYDSGKP